jgi:hypothetical protein
MSSKNDNENPELIPGYATGDSKSDTRRDLNGKSRADVSRYNKKQTFRNSKPQLQ